VVVVAATTGLAAASVLPAPVQRAVAAAAAKVGLDLPQPTQRVVASPPTTVAQPDLAPLVVSLPPLNPPGTEPTPTTAAPAQPTAAVPEAAPQAPPDPAAGAAAVKDPPPAATPATPSPATPARPEATPPPTPAPVLPTVPPVVQPPAPPGIAAFRQAVVAYVMCLRAADGDPVKVGACVFPNPADFGLSGWPWDIPRPSRDQP
jgi:hypothetical protein